MKKVTVIWAPPEGPTPVRYELYFRVGNTQRLEYSGSTFDAMTIVRNRADNEKFNLAIVPVYSVEPLEFGDAVILNFDLADEQCVYSRGLPVDQISVTVEPEG